MKQNKAAKILTPVFIFIICVAIFVLVLIKPYTKVKGLMKVAINSASSEDSGLNITDSDIDTSYSGKTYEKGSIEFPKFGEKYAIIKTNALEGEIPVYWGSTDELLEKGACQSSASTVIGKTGNSVISGHVDTVFSGLDKIKKGDKITLYTNYGRFTYKVTDTVKFMKTDKSYVSSSNEEKLTLYTCKNDIFGSSDVRVAVIASPEKHEFYNPETGNESEKESEK